MRRRWPLIGVLTLLTYNTWALWSPLNGHERILNGYLSELSASNQPNNLVFRGGDLISALIVGALGLLAFRVWPRLVPRSSGTGRRWWVLAAGGLVLFAVSTFFDSFFSMDCSPTLSGKCRVLEETGRLSLVHYAHTYTSVGAQTGVVASMVAAYVALRLSGRGGRWRGPLLVLCVGEVGSLAVLLLMLAVGAEGIGYPQAITVLLASVWFAVVGVALARPPARKAPPGWARKEESRVA